MARTVFVLTVWLNLLSAATLAAQEVTGEAVAQFDQLLKEADAAPNQNDFAGMLAKSEAALALARAAADDRRSAQALQRKGTALFYLARPAEALDASRAGLALAEKTTDEALIARLLNNVGVTLRETGDYEGAIDHLQRSLSHMQTLGNLIEQARILRNISALYYRVNEAALAESTAHEAYNLAVKANDRTFEALTLQSTSGASRLKGDFAQAAATIERALAIDLPESGLLRLLRKELLTDLADVEYYRGRFEESRTASLTALAIAEPYPLVDGYATLGVGVATFELGDPAAALDWLYKARAMLMAPGASAVTYARIAATAEYWIARALRATNQREQAVTLLQSSLATTERMRVGMGVTETSAARMLASPSTWGATIQVSELVDLLFEMGRVEDAFDATERWRARLFLDQLDERRSGVGRVLTPEQRARETSIAQRAAVLQRQSWDLNVTPARRAELERELQGVDRDLDALRREVRRADPKYGHIRYPDILNASRVRTNLDGESVVVAYLMGPQRSYVWAISKEGVAAALLPSGEMLKKRTAAFRAMLIEKPTGGSETRLDAIEREGAALYRLLVAPVAGSLRGKKRVTFIADGPLHLLPMEAMRSDGHWLLEHLDISYAPSASALAAIARTNSGPPGALQLFAVGDPVFPTENHSAPVPSAERALMFSALPYTRVEVDSVAALFPPRARSIHLGADAREETIKQAPLADFRFVHFASHAYLNPTRPGRSGIVLSVDPKSSESGVLEADEVMDLQLNADLVTLSACSTGTGELIGPEGVVGLARAFLYAGARSVAASLWNVNDSATAQLMRAFYAQLQKGVARDEALRRAKMDLASSEGPLRDPYYWAPFVLIGLPK